MRSSLGFDVRDWDGCLDKVGLALRDWQPSPWKRKQKGPYINRGKWSWSCRKTVMWPGNFGMISTKMCMARTLTQESGGTKSYINFCVYIIMHVQAYRMCVFSGLSRLSVFFCAWRKPPCAHSVPGAIVSASLMDSSHLVSFSSLCLPLLFSPVSYPCIPPGAD